MSGLKQGRRYVAARARRWAVAAALILAAGATLAADPPGTITTVAGGGVGDGAPATSASVQDPFGVAVDGNGSLFIADTSNHRIRKVAPNGTISTVAGNGLDGFSGDGGLATSARLWFPSGVAVGGDGSLFVADRTNQRIRKVAPDGTISTVAGVGYPNNGFWGDGGPATSAGLWNPTGVAVDGAGNLFIADSGNYRVRRVGTDGVIMTVAGNGTGGASGDGGPATSASLGATGVAVDGVGNVFIADTGRLRKVALNGTISTVASGQDSTGVAVDGAGNLFVAEGRDHRVRKVAPDGTISTAAGPVSDYPSNHGFWGEGWVATSAGLSDPTGVAVDAAGNLFIADGGMNLLLPGRTGNHRVRKVAANGIITTVAGNGTTTFAGDGGPATEASLGSTGFSRVDDGRLGIALDGAGQLFIADTGNHRIRKVAADGTISTVAGNGANVGSGDGGPATAAFMNWPAGVAVDGVGNLFVAELSGAGGGGAGQRVRKVTAADGTISTIDGGANPTGVAVDASGNVYVADSSVHHIRKVAPDGTVIVVAGTGHGSFSGDGGPATSAGLSYPNGVAVDGVGNLFIADTGNSRIRRVAPDGTISTVAGGGHPSFPGDGGPATSASFLRPKGVAVDRAGNLFIADTDRGTVRKVAPDGTISTVAGNGSGGFSGDGGPATSASIGFPTAVALDRSGNLFIADHGNRRIRKVAAAPAGSVVAPAAIVQECDEVGEGATVHFVLDVTPGTADLLRARDVTGDRLLLQVAYPAEQQYGIGPVVFPHGASTVLIELLDGATVVASAQFAVQIEDTIAPVLEGCEPTTIELQGPLTPLDAALLGITVSDACDPNPTVTFADGALGLGTTPVTATARDASGNTSSCTFDVTVVDTTPPAFTVCPEDMERHCEAGGVLVSFDVLAEDLSGAVGIGCEDETARAVDKSGTLFDVGEHTVTCTATDSSGNTATCSFLVTVIDDDAPAIVCPEDITVGNEPGTCFAYVAFSVTATDECDPDVGIVTTAPWGPVQSGDAFPMGTTTVTATARDHSGNEATCSFNITVEDREPPVLSGPNSVTLVTDCAGSPLTVTPASLGVTATDNCDTDVAIVAAPSSVAPGTTAVVCTATDDDGNASEKSVQVTVLNGPFECRVLRPLDHNVDNLIQPGQTVPVKVRISCENIFEPGVMAVIDSAVQVDGEGTPVGNDLTEDSGASSDNGNVMRLVAADEQHIYNLSTKGWPTTAGARFRVTLRITMAGHVDTLCDVILKNK